MQILKVVDLQIKIKYCGNFLLSSWRQQVIFLVRKEWKVFYLYFLNLPEVIERPELDLIKGN